LDDGFSIPIEERSGEEVRQISGLPTPRSKETSVCLIAEGSPTANPAFDVTPRRLVTELITERGRCAANERAIAALFPEFDNDQARQG
jgi:methylthioribose-1-phosphate isomerase